MLPSLIGKRSKLTWVVVSSAIVLLLILIGVATLSGGVGTANDSVEPSEPAGIQSSAPTAPATTPCDAGQADTPATPPADAVVVSTEDKLPDIIAAHPPRTTYWLTSGTHHLASGEYSQVIPQAGDTFIGAEGAVIDGRHDNRYAFGGTATDVTIESLTIQNFGSPGDNNDEGVVNHDSAEGWTVLSSTIQNNAGAGIMIGSRSRLTGNCLRNNGQYGFNAYHPDGVHDITLDRNEIAGNNTDDWEVRRPGCGCTGGGKFWETRNASVIDNYVHGNHSVGIWADTNNTGFRFEGNYIADNDAEGIFYETSYNAAIVRNTFVGNAIVKGPTNPKFPASAVYLSESGGDDRVPGDDYGELRVSENRFINNWSGVIAWENANRFAGSEANTSTGASTLVNPAVTAEKCMVRSNIKQQPYIDDCRWKTQNVVIERNTFQTDMATIPLCVEANGCGFNGVFSNYGTFPAWSPYKRQTVERAITFEQNNVWRNNTYTGTWHFMAEEAGKSVTWDEWRSAPYNQDAGSVKS